MGPGERNIAFLYGHRIGLSNKPEHLSPNKLTLFERRPVSSNERERDGSPPDEGASSAGNRRGKWRASPSSSVIAVPSRSSSSSCSRCSRSSAGRSSWKSGGSFARSAGRARASSGSSARRAVLGGVCGRQEAPGEPVRPALPRRAGRNWRRHSAAPRRSTACSRRARRVSGPRCSTRSIGRCAGRREARSSGWSAISRSSPPRRSRRPSSASSARSGAS